MHLDPVLLAQVIVSGVLMGLIYALIAMGLTLIWGVMDIVNFAHGDFLMFSMYFAFWAFTLWGVDPSLFLPLGIAALFILGVLTYQTVIRRVLHAPMLSQILCTFGLVVFMRGSAQFLWTPNYRLITGAMVTGRLTAGGVFISLPQTVAALGALLCAVVLYWLINKTETGWALQATAEDRAAASLMGIPSHRMFSLAWGLGIGSVGVAGTLLANFYYIFPNVGEPFQLFALVAVALGGFGSISGALLAGVIIGLVEAISGFLIAPAYKYLFVFVIYLIVIIKRPQGLFGTH